MGLLAHDVDTVWSDDRAEHGFDWSLEAELARGAFSIWDGRARPSLGLSVHSRRQTHKVYAGWLWERPLAERGFLNLGLGLAWHTGRTMTSDPDRKELGTRWQFRVPIEVGIELRPHHRLILSYDHLSNAGLDDENEGLDTVGLRYGYRF